ncbi:fimbrial biogenesis chaperone [Klebsiella aerogenes]|uniref:fimbrial biogenesis chaperone n=1 Tax=Klebsiella aerogenes TaxID=548 RepID=UPI0009498526|nr:molecular chaperone [Klebsiella aerogenes]
MNQKIYCGIILTCISYNTFAIQLSSSRIIYNENDKQVIYRIKNDNTTSPFLIQTWVSTYNSSDASSDFIVTPPLVNLQPDAVNDLRILFSSSRPFANEHESMYRLNILSIPAVENTGTSKVVLTSKASLKLIYRPLGLSSQGAKEAFNKLIVKQVQNKLILSNPTPYFINLREVSLNGRKLSSEQFMKISTVSPFSSAELDNVMMKVKAFNYSAIDDNGASNPLQINLNAIHN